MGYEAVVCLDSMLVLPTLNSESELWQRGYRAVAGVDEVGRGCWAGPVVAAAVIMPPGLEPSKQLISVRDSKALRASQRKSLVPQIQEQCLDWGLGLATVAEIDRLNILQATYLAMQRALAALGTWDYALIDGKISPRTDFKGAWAGLIRGDQLSYSIACAAIIAKVKRDQWLEDLHARYPAYQWARNKGYGTKVHHQALYTHGITPWHRRSFAPIRAISSTGSSQTP